MHTSNFVYITNLPVIIVNEKELTHKHPLLGMGAEGYVYKYDDNYAIKIFREMDFNYGYKEIQKMAKIAKLSELKDESFCFPIGLVGFEDYSKHGYYMKYIKAHPDHKGFDYFKSVNDNEILLEVLMKANDALERIHKKGVIIGDLRASNIIIDTNNNPIYIDTDNYMYSNFIFDLTPNRANTLEDIYGAYPNLEDNDKLLFAIMALEALTGDSGFNIHQSKEGFDFLIKELKIDKETREIIEAIFSDSENKPYMGPALKRINPKQKLY